MVLQVQQHIELQNEIQGKVKCVVVDPDVRTFATFTVKKKHAWLGQIRQRETVPANEKKRQITWQS